MKISTADRPYLLTFHATGTSHRVTSDDVQQLLDKYPPITADPDRVVLPGPTADPHQRVSITPATAGDPAFIIDTVDGESGAIWRGATAPDPAAYQLWWATDIAQLLVWDGVFWVVATNPPGEPWR